MKINGKIHINSFYFLLRKRANTKQYDQSEDSREAIYFSLFMYLCIIIIAF